jgi:hypothetical protein
VLDPFCACETTIHAAQNLDRQLIGDRHHVSGDQSDQDPNKQMRNEAADAGRPSSKLWHDEDYPRIQMLTVEML